MNRESLKQRRRLVFFSGINYGYADMDCGEVYDRMKEINPEKYHITGH